VLDLLGDNIRLGVRVHEAAHAPRPAPARPAGAAARPRVLAKGRVSGLARGGHLLSILLPTKNGAAQLRELLPAVLGQRTDDRIEIVAVDSGSEDDTVEVLRRFGATVVAIEPRAFGHGPTRNLASRHARGDAFVFINQSTLPADDRWLANLVAPLWDDPALAGVCSRMLPREDADLLVRRDGLRDPNGAPESSVRAIGDWLRHQRLTDHELRLLINFHTVSAAIRPRVFAQVPFRDVLIGEDVLWAKEVLEAGLKIRHEASSVVFHSHRYSYLEHLERNVDDGFANRLIVGRQVADDAVAPSIAAQVRDDWRYLAECGLGAEELDEWRLMAALRRTAQVVGQWIGSNHDRLPGDLVAFLSLTERIKAGAQGAGAGPGN
jgi:rhamnosyltransferase